MKQLFLLAILFAVTGNAIAQKGTLTGVIVDDNTGEELIGVNIYIPSLETGGVTDITGRYNIRLEPGTYTLEVSFITHHKKIIEDVEILAGETTTLDITLTEASRELDEVVVSARRMDNNEVSLLRLQKRSLPVQDGISAQEIRRIGFSNSAESMRQVTGASVEGGSYVVMRGLGDRYSISSMDGIVLPATNPYRNSASLDLIPASMVDNIVVKKTFSPDLPGNFTGGAVDITTKSLPDQYYLRLSTSASFNDQTTFNNNFLRDPVNNNLRRLGFDDGSRGFKNSWSDNDYLTRLNTYLIQIQNNTMTDAEIETFNETMRSFSSRPFTVSNNAPEFDHSLNISFGNRHLIGEKQIGYNFGINYSKSYVQYDEREINSYSARIPDQNSSSSRMLPFQLNRGSESIDEVTNGYIGSLTFQLNPFHEITATSIYNNNGTESVLDMNKGSYPGALSSGTYNNRVLSFKQRQLFNNQLKGRHSFEPFEVRWSANYITSSQYEPNTRYIGSPVDSDGSYFFVREVQLPFHFFRDLGDTQINGKADLEYKFTNRISLKTGGSFSRKDRDFDEFRFQLEDNGTDPEGDFLSFREASGDFENFFSPNNTGVIGRDENGNPILGLTYRDQTRPENSYVGSEQIAAAYLMGVFDVTNKLKIFGGARLEKTDFTVTSGTGSRLREGVIDVVDVLPSVNAIYALTDDSNLRLSGSQTLARPNMRELAPFSSFDLLGGFPIVGNPSLTRTNILNGDFRYELFPAAGELFAVSVFYKNFTNPIVLELDVATDQPQYQYINTNSGELYGFEVEFRKKLDFIAPALSNFKFSTNFTYTNSRVDLSDEEFQTRRQLDPNIKSYRPFPYQSPYIANAMVIYENPENGWDGAIYANVFGPRLAANGSGAAPDTYEIYGKLNSENRITSNRPLPDLSIRVQKNFMNRLSASLSVSNLLDYSVIQYQEDSGTYFTNSAYNPGRTVKLSFTYSIN